MPTIYKPKRRQERTGDNYYMKTATARFAVAVKSILSSMKAIRDNHVPGEKAVTCPKCGEASEQKLVAQGLSVCPKCGYHFPIGAYYRLSTILDSGTFRELNEKYPAGDPLSFPDYREKLAVTQRKTGLTEAVVTATGAIGGTKCVVGVLDSRFFMGSMSTAVGEKITLAIEFAAKNRLPLILFSASGGARMQEGILSLMAARNSGLTVSRAREMPCRMAPAWPVTPPPVTVQITSTFPNCSVRTRGCRTISFSVSRPK